MKKIQRIVLLVLVIGLIVGNSLVVHATGDTSVTFTGVVLRIVGSQVYFSTTSAATYAAEIGNTSLFRKFGAPMQFSEIKIGDKIEVRGTLFSDNSISATYFHDLSFYTHDGTFEGKVLTLDLIGSNFTMQNKQYGIQTIDVKSNTIFKKNGTVSALANLAPGLSVTVKGTWDRDTVVVTAKEVSAILRWISIDTTGTLVLKGDGSVTVTGENNVIYGVDTSHAQYKNAKGKIILPSRMNLGDLLRVNGTHLSGGTQIIGSTIKDLSVLK